MILYYRRSRRLGQLAEPAMISPVTLPGLPSPITRLSIFITGTTSGSRSS
ncbi:MAG: hypothetical protein R3F23_08565 [Verrucomicrobiia bacterium]